MKRLLPLGSVVLPKNGKRRFMIFGRMQIQEGQDKIWDYAGCLYPEGNIDPQHNFLFDHEDIARIFFIGFQDSEEFSFMKNLSERANAGEQMRQMDDSMNDNPE